MPNSRGRRVASNQSRVSQRRRRGRGPSGTPATPSEPPQQLGGEEPEVGAPAAAVAAAAPRTAAAIAPVRRTEPRSRPTVYQYVKPEIKRILVLSGAIIAVLVVLSFVLD